MSTPAPDTQSAMPQTHHLSLPLNELQIHALNVGDLVYLSGEIVISAGMPTYQRMLAWMDQGKALPIELGGGALFHLGSYSRELDPATGAMEVVYMNPTTSTRFSDFMPRLIRGHGLRLVGGKGGLDERSVEAMREVGCAYLSFLGGGCTLLSEAIREVVAVEWRDLIFHYRLVKLRVENLGPATVGMDAKGNSLYGRLNEDAAARLPAIMAQLAARRAASMC